jgi:ribosome-associated protein
VARKVVEVLEDRQSSDVVLLDLRAAATFADYFVIGTGETKRHLDALQDEIKKVLDQEGVPRHHLEGTSEGGWVLLDYSK